MKQKYYDKNSRELKIGQLVATRYNNAIGKLIRISPDDGEIYCYLKYYAVAQRPHWKSKYKDNIDGWYPDGLTIITDEEAMLWMLEN
jgi:hypothetical protein